jgi:acyl-CoA synthetase (AMP-forming)/AMP-acid ligase II
MRFSDKPAGSDGGRDRQDATGVAFASIVDLLRHRAVEQPHDRAYVFLSDRGTEQATLTFAELHRRAHALAALLLRRAQPGDRALLLFPSGLDFVVAFLACLAGRLIPVPIMLPRRASGRGATEAITADCAPRLALTTRAMADARPDVIERFRGTGLEWIILDPADALATAEVSVPAAGRDDIALLQYTSGSTADPKGVVVTHGNVLANSEMIRRAFAGTPTSAFVSWVPHYHDMGLILNIMQTLYLGTLCVLMAPATFVHRPLTWLRAIHSFRAEIATGPNFAYDLCVQRFRPDQLQGLDLSCWKLALNGAEPVRQDTIDRFVATFAPYGFSPSAVYPAYGLAEATLLVSGGRRGAGVVGRQVSRGALAGGHVAAATPDDCQSLIGCGRELVGERIAIVDPQTCERRAANRVGEIWVDGPNVTKGYWQNAEATAATFQARIMGEAGQSWLRTGDLGFVDDDGELFVTGRIKDVIIIRGMNHYPQDIESTVQGVHPALSRNCGAAFVAEDANGRERLVIVQEVERTFRRQIDASELVASIREAVVEEHEINVDEMVFIAPGTLPKTTSGKVQRRLTRRLWADGALEQLA